MVWQAGARTAPRGFVAGEIALCPSSTRHASQRLDMRSEKKVERGCGDQRLSGERERRAVLGMTKAPAFRNRPGLAVWPIKSLRRKRAAVA
ncbi:MAG: hypothetical protein DI589_23915 [Shinella sp.]|nr:MAG: hypothetical protein DI589_23915 [Shinella sp.]